MTMMINKINSCAINFTQVFKLIFTIPGDWGTSAAVATKNIRHISQLYV